MKNKRNLNTKWLLLQNDQNADTTLLHSHDDIFSKNTNKKCTLIFFCDTCTECSLSIQKSIPEVTLGASTLLQIKSPFYNKGDVTKMLRRGCVTSKWSCATCQSIWKSHSPICGMLAVNLSEDVWILPGEELLLKLYIFDLGMK